MEGCSLVFQALSPHNAMVSRASARERAVLRMEGASRAERHLLEALSLPEVCLLEHCADQRAILQGRISDIARRELEETVESSLGLLDDLGLDSESYESFTPSPDECVPLSLGLRRQPSFRPASMLTDDEQQRVRSRRHACVMRLARSAMGRTASKISKCRPRWHTRQAEPARQGEP